MIPLAKWPNNVVRNVNKTVFSHTPPPSVCGRRVESRSMAPIRASAGPLTSPAHESTAILCMCTPAPHPRSFFLRECRNYTGDRAESCVKTPADAGRPSAPGLSCCVVCGGTLVSAPVGARVAPVVPNFSTRAFPRADFSRLRREPRHYRTALPAAPQRGRPSAAKVSSHDPQALSTVAHTFSRLIYRLDAALKPAPTSPR